VDIITGAFYLHLESFGFDRTIYCLKYANNISALNTATDRPLSRSHTLQEMPALVLQWLDRFNAGTDDVAIPDLESKLAVVQGLLFDGTDTFLKYSHLLNPVQVIEDDPLVTLDDYNFARFVRIGPADVDVSEDVVRITERNETDIIPAVT
jgi:hypothetical protein